MRTLGGASSVITGDTREEVIEKARTWYEKGLVYMLEPRAFIYGEGETELTYYHCHDKECPYCQGEPFKANIIIVDTTERPKDAESEYPFPFFNQMSNTPKERAKRFHAFVSAHT